MDQPDADITIVASLGVRQRPSSRGSGWPSLAARVDSLVGFRIRERRVMLGLTQADLAARTNVTYQQIHKYEVGVNRLSAGKLYTFAKALEVEVADFFQGLDSGADASTTEQMTMLAGLMRDVGRLSTPAQQEAVCRVARVMAGVEE